MFNELITIAPYILAGIVLVFATHIAGRMAKSAAENASPEVLRILEETERARIAILDKLMTILLEKTPDIPGELDDEIKRLIREHFDNENKIGYGGNG